MGWINFLMEEAEGYKRELILKKVVRPFKVYTCSNNGTLMGMEINRQHKLDLQCVVTRSVMTPTNRTSPNETGVKVTAYTSSMANSRWKPPDCNTVHKTTPATDLHCVVIRSVMTPTNRTS